MNHVDIIDGFDEMLGMPPPGPERERWDRVNTLISLEWRTIGRQVSEYETQKGHALSTAARANMHRAFRKRLRDRYGITDVDPQWVQFDAKRREENAKAGRNCWPGDAV